MPPCPRSAPPRYDAPAHGPAPILTYEVEPGLAAAPIALANGFDGHTKLVPYMRRGTNAAASKTRSLPLLFEARTKQDGTRYETLEAFARFVQGAFGVTLPMETSHGDFELWLVTGTRQ